MKKRILFSLLVAMLICVLAFTVSAAGSESNEYADGDGITTFDGVTEPEVISKDARTVLLASDGTYYTIPSYYILQDQAIFRWKQNADVSALLGYSPSNANSDFRPYVVRMEIPEGITQINPGTEGGACAFEDAKKLIEATIPSTVTVIGNYSFNRANSLTTLNGFESFMERATKLGSLMVAETAWGEGVDLIIPSTITSVPSNCFKGTKIKSVTFSEGLTVLGNHVFASCSSLASVDVSKCSSLTEIGEYCFEKTKITSFDFTPFATKLTSLGNGVFNGCTALKEVIGYEKAENITKVGDKMFNNCALTEIEFPANITSIGSYALYSFDGEVYVNIPNTVTTIGSYAFQSSNITGVSLPDSLVELSNHVFANCSKLAKIDTEGCTSITTIGKYCFEKCAKLTSFDFTPFATKLTSLGDGVFNECTSLSTVKGLKDLVNIKTLPEKIFFNCPLTYIELPQNLETVGIKAFSGHKSTQDEFRMPNTVTTIGDHAFTRNGVGGGSKIYLSASLTTISNNYTFENWTHTEMYIPASVTNIITGFVNGNSEKGVVYYYTGDLNGFTINETNNKAMTGATWISASDFKGASTECNYIVYGYNVCDAFYNSVHTCPDAQKVVTSYFEEINVIGNCTVCSEQNVTAYTIPALFINLGFTHTKDKIGGSYSVAQGYGINSTAVAQYGEIDFGLIASGAENPLSIVNGEAVASMGVLIKGDSFETSYFEIKVNGITEETVDASIVFCAYVVDGEVIHYLDNGSSSTTVGGHSYTEVSSK